jgi:predicted XRE-type DNA-binding protein
MGCRDMRIQNYEFSNVWDALTDTPEESANMSMRSNLLIAIQKKFKAGT